MGNEGVPADKASQKATGVDDDDRGKTEVGQFEDDDQHGSSPDVGGGSEEVKQAGQKAWEGHDTQDASKSEEGAVYAPEKSAEKVGESITERAEDRATKHKEPGRVMDESDTAEKDAGGKARPAGKSDARMSTSVDPQDPIDDESPHLPAGDQGG
jgi:hypothetical protein